jgi:hypothetical protein
MLLYKDKIKTELAGLSASAEGPTAKGGPQQGYRKTFPHQNSIFYVSKNFKLIQ